MERFTKQNAQAMRKEIQDALTELAKKYGATVEVGNIKYGSALDAKIMFSKLSENEHGSFVNTRAAQEFVKRAKDMGLYPDMLNEPMTYKGKNIVILGYSTRAKKYPIEYTENGEKYKCSVAFMKSMVKETRPEFFL